MLLQARQVHEHPSYMCCSFSKEFAKIVQQRTISSLCYILQTANLAACGTFFTTSCSAFGFCLGYFLCRGLLCLTPRSKPCRRIIDTLVSSGLSTVIPWHVCAGCWSFVSTRISCGDRPRESVRSLYPRRLRLDDDTHGSLQDGVRHPLPRSGETRRPTSFGGSRNRRCWHMW